MRTHCFTALNISTLWLPLFKLCSCSDKTRDNQVSNFKFGKLIRIFDVQDSPSGSGMAWRDYSEVNYGYDAYDSKEFQVGGNTIPLTAAPTAAVNYQYNGGGGPSHITNMSLPRPQSQSKAGGHRGHAPNSSHHPHHHHSSHHHSSTNGHGNGGGGSERHVSSSNAGNGAAAAMSHNNPDFYFMPSQRKYSGEVVRVYVDHNNKR